MTKIIWSIGFRPFFLFGSLSGVLLIVYWSLAFFTGDLPALYFDAISWHAHEMLYGFTIAIIAGFLLTASANWTATRPLSGQKLTGLFILWLSGRILFALALLGVPLPVWLISLVDVLFLPILLLALAPPLIKAKQLRNLQFLPVLALLSIGNLLTHLGALEVVSPTMGTKGIYLGLDLILIIMIIIGGRIVPAFTGNALKGVQVKTWYWVENSVMVSVWLFVLLDFLEEGTGISAWVSLAAGILNFVRLSGWGWQKTQGTPLLWVLHLGYLWICLGFVLVFLSDYFGLLPRSVSIHAFTAGAMGTFIIGMISRVSLGHTGRVMQLPRGFVVAYYCVSLGALSRVVSGFAPEWYGEGILISGLLWALGFALFILFYSRILLSPRANRA